MYPDGTEKLFKILYLIYHIEHEENPEASF